ncbi:hypothetical protein ACLI4U_00260 [Natrialbaceae archaeon A-CW2]|uniref:hypothetical protein n=1 Tax=Natronosalvus amylolyticus TaxID=2961994 RepID=UPI0020C97B6D|nr:hypothetical protein [Natronosalvus amylolyticus]
MSDRKQGTCKNLFLIGFGGGDVSSAFTLPDERPGHDAENGTPEPSVGEETRYGRTVQRRTGLVADR